MWASFGLLEVEIGQTQSWRNTFRGPGRSQHNKVCTRGVLLYQFITFPTLAESANWARQGKLQSQVHHSNTNSVKTTLPCTTLGFSSAMLTIVMDVKTMTQSVPISSLNDVNGTSADQGTWRCGLPAKIYWQRVNVCARVDGFKKNVSQSTRWSSPQPENFGLA